MPLSNYGELKTAVGTWLERPDLVDVIPDFVTLAEDRIYSEVRVREMEKEDSITTVAAQQKDTQSNLTRYRGVKRLYVDDAVDVSLEYRDPDNFWSVYGNLATGRPYAYTLEAENFVWGPTPDQPYSIRALYWQGLAPFSAEADTNALFAKHPGLYLYAGLLEAALFLNEDSDIIKYTHLYDQAVELAQTVDARDRQQFPGPL